MINPSSKNMLCTQKAAYKCRRLLKYIKHNRRFIKKTLYKNSIM
nr:MAG TPA: hypothetical protein [Caudoviricetes sp.]